MATKLSNVIGAPFSDYVLTQLYLRAEKNSSINRTNSEVLFLANKTAWARLVSSVNIVSPTSPTVEAINQPQYFTAASEFSSVFSSPAFQSSIVNNNVINNPNNSPKQLTTVQNFYKGLGLNTNIYQTKTDLAQNWVLEAGTSIQTGNGITLREGLGIDGAYGLRGTEELGYRPMPGLTSVQVETTGRLGSLRQATISFKVWNMDQLNVIEALYFRLGYSMLLEWGHTQYYQNNQPSNLKTNEVYGIDDPFGRDIRKERVQQEIAKKTKMTSGNYDGMLGIVSNFTWAFNQDGGYDCTVRLVGLGAVMESLRINQAYKLPDGLVQEYKKNVQTIQDAKTAAEIAALQKEIDNLKKVDNTEKVQNLPKPPKTSVELFNIVDTLGNKNYTTRLDFQSAEAAFVEEFGAPAILNFEKSNFPITISPLDYYVKFKGNSEADNNVLNKNYGGLWITRNNQFSVVRLGDNVDFNAAALAQQIRYFPPVVLDGGKVSSLGSLSGLSNELASFLDYKTKTYLPAIYNPNDASDGFQKTPTDVGLPESLQNDSIVYRPEQPLTLKLPFGLGLLEDKYYETKISWTITDLNGEGYVPTQIQLVNALQGWAEQKPVLNNILINFNGTYNIEITGTFTTPIKDVKYSGPKDANLEALAAERHRIKAGEKTTVDVTWTLKTNNTGFILGVNSINSNNPNTNKTGTAATGDNEGKVNQSTTGQTDAPEGFASALEAMLTVVQTKGQAAARNESTFKVVDIIDDTKAFYKDGALNGVLTNLNATINTSTGVGAAKQATIASTNATTKLDNVPFDLVKYAQKGFSSNLMVDPTLYSQISYVDFKNLCNAYVVKYPQNAVDGAPDKVQSPVYIQLGYLLAFLNNMCLIYDSTQDATDITKVDGTQKRPYVYIDFNPETNFCLTSPQQFSIDPMICLVPCNATDYQFNSLFPPPINQTISTFKPAVFSPTNSNNISKLLNSNGLTYKNNNIPFQGKTMSILLNTQYLLNIVQGYAGSDAAHAVKLQIFLERILLDVNKSMGNINAFRVAYRDDTNTIQIQDDQWVPSTAEATMMVRKPYIDSLQTNKQVSGLLPIFNTPGTAGKIPTLSMVRQFQLKTTLSTKLASMIAISAQSNTTSVNATDHSELSYLNQHFQDRYKPWIQDPSNGASGTNTTATGSNDQKLAQLFSDHVNGVYGNVNNLDLSKIEMAKNYYIERMSKVKSGDPITTAAPFIPADLEMTIDGISGIIMGNAFTIPENRLPMSLRGEDGFTKVGFIVVGLTHTIQNNEWLTMIRGQMIKLRESTAYGITQQITSTQVVPPTIANNTSTGFNNTIDTEPWSAAFISYVVNKAGVDFPFNAAHTGYAQALRTNSSYGFEVLDPKGTVLQPGDIIVQNRDGNNLTFYSNKWSGNSHGDIVVSTNGSNAAVVGGNISNAVTQLNLTLSKGTLGSPNYFVVLRPPQNSANKIVSAANAEYELWKSNNWKEQTPAARATLAAYYKIVGITI